MEILPIPAKLIAQCQSDSIATGRRVLELLQEKCATSPAVFTSQLGKTLHYPVLEMASLRECAPVFEVLVFADAMRRGNDT